MGWADTVEAAVACAWALSIESFGKRVSLLDICSTRRLQRMSSSFVIAGVSKGMGTHGGKLVEKSLSVVIHRRTREMPLCS